MKKIRFSIVILMLIAICGCSASNNKNGKEILTNKEFAKIWWEVNQSHYDAYTELGKIGLYGTSNDENEKTDHARSIYEKYSQKVLDKYNIKIGERIKVAFIPDGSTKKADDGIIVCNIVDETKEYFDCPIYFKDDSIIGIKDKTVIVEGEFTETHPGSLAFFNNCVVIAE